MHPTFINGKGETICVKCNKPGPHSRCKRDGTNGKVTLLELEEAAEKLCKQHWKRSFTGKIVFGFLPYGIVGSYDPSNHTITMSETKNAKRDRETVFGFLLHELVHWHMHTSGLPSRDRDPEFAEECLRVGAFISRAEHARDALSEVEIAERMERFGFLLAEGR